MLFQKKANAVFYHDKYHVPLLGMGNPRWHGGKESACQFRRLRFDPWVGKIPWGWKWQRTPVSLPGKFQGQRSLVGYDPWGPNSQTWLSTHMENVALRWQMGGWFLLFSVRCKSIQIPHTFWEQQWRIGLLKRDFSNDNLSPPGLLPRLAGPHLWDDGWTASFWKVVLLWKIILFHPDPVKLMRQARLLSHMAKRTLGKQICISLRCNSLIKCDN